MNQVHAAGSWLGMKNDARMPIDSQNAAISGIAMRLAVASSRARDREMTIMPRPSAALMATGSRCAGLRAIVVRMKSDAARASRSPGSSRRAIARLMRARRKSDVPAVVSASCICRRCAAIDAAIATAIVVGTAIMA